MPSLIGWARLRRANSNSPNAPPRRNTISDAGSALTTALPDHLLLSSDVSRPNESATSTNDPSSVTSRSHTLCSAASQCNRLAFPTAPPTWPEVRVVIRLLLLLFRLLLCLELLPPLSLDVRKLLLWRLLSSCCCCCCCPRRDRASEHGLAPRAATRGARSLCPHGAPPPQRRLEPRAPQRPPPASRRRHSPPPPALSGEHLRSRSTAEQEHWRRSHAALPPASERDGRAELVPRVSRAAAHGGAAQVGGVAQPQRARIPACHPWLARAHAHGHQHFQERFISERFRRERVFIMRDNR
jgi:hypothetical protein